MRLILAILLLATPALADDPPPQPIEIGTQAGWQLLGGLTSGVSFDGFGASRVDTGGYLGGELSLNRLHHRTWMGLYGDAFYEFGQSATYLTAGPQLGYALIGVDGGLAFRTGDNDPTFGYTARLLLAAAFVDLYGRVFLFDGEDHWQVGLMLKMPLWASE
jgi:hypothetical protein